MLVLPRRKTLGAVQIAQRYYAATVPKTEATDTEEDRSFDHAESSYAAQQRALQQSSETASESSSQAVQAAMEPFVIPKTMKNIDVGVNHSHSKFAVVSPSSNAEGKSKSPPPRVKGANRTRAFLKAQAFAKALSAQQSDVTTPATPVHRIPRPSTKETGIEEPTLDDLLAKKPFRKPISPKGYRSRYEALVESIDKAFVFKQIKKFAQEMRLRYSIRDNKAMVIVKILKAWDWDPPVEPEPPKTAKGPKVEHDFEVTPAELFMFLRDVDTLKTLIQRSNMHISVLPATLEPMQMEASESGEEKMKPAGKRIIRVKGIETTIQQVSLILQSKRSIMRTSLWNPSDVLGIVASPELMQSVSNISGALVEMDHKGNYAISGLHPLPMRRARRLLRKAAVQSNILPPTRDLTAISPVTDTKLEHQPEMEYHLPPYFPTYSSPIPWYFQAAASNQPMFRLRRVTNWATKTGRGELTHVQENLQDAEIHIAKQGNIGVSLNASKLGEVVQASRDLEGMKEFDNIIEGEMVTKVQFGHLLFSTSETGPTATFQSPIPGQAKLPDMISKLGKLDSAVMFAENLAPAMIHQPLEGPSKRVKRVRYRLLPEPGLKGTITFTCEYTFPDDDPSTPKIPSPGDTRAQESSTLNTESNGIRDAASVERRWQDELGMMLDQAEKDLEAEDSAVQKMDKVTLDDVGLEENSETSPVPVVQAVAEDAVSTEEHSEEEVEDEDNEEPEDNEAPGNLFIPKAPYTSELSWSREIDMLMPNRPIDARMTISNTVQYAKGRIPRKIHKLFGRFHKFHTEFPMAPFLPPPEIKLEINDEPRLFILDSYEELEIRETEIRQPQEASSIDQNPDPFSTVTAAITPLEPEMEGDIKEIIEKSDEGMETQQTEPRIWLRSIKAIDQNIRERPSTYTELETRGDTVPEGFWKQFASVTREVPPDQAKLRYNQYAF